MILDEKDIEELHATGRGGRPLRPLSKPEPPNGELIAVLRQMTAAITQAAAKQTEPPVITLRPEITVTPTLATEPVAPLREWKVEVTERDLDKRIKSMTIKAAE